MSKIGKQIIAIPKGTEVKNVDGTVTVKGPKGTLSRNFKDDVDFAIDNKSIRVSPKRDDKFGRAIWGTCASHLKNMIRGVNEMYEKKLILEGVGYKSEVAGTSLNLALGFSHPVKIPIPEGIKVVSDKTGISISGIDKEKVGGFAAYIRSLKKPEPYKGKGFHYIDEHVRRKQGKKTA